MNFYILIKKILKRLYYVFYFNPTKKILRKIINYSLYKNPKFLRSSSKPYISGDTFRKLANHVFDETQSLSVKKVKLNQIVFLKTDLIDIFFKEYHPLIQNPYILITHNSDKNVNKDQMKYLDNKIIHWFSQNLNINSNKQISILPIGFENRRFQNSGKLFYLKRISKNYIPKNKFILSSFNVNTNITKRLEVLNISNSNQAIDFKLFSTTKEYFNNLKEYKFLICPEGNGIDTHRVWEALLVNTIPIVIKSIYSDNLKKLGIPIYELDNWSTLSNLDIETLEETYIQLSKYDFKKFIKLKFWIEEINNKKL